MKNYYELLEINEKASQEIIEKVYKVLVKKYHPDLQEDAETKTKYEEIIKEINEAYEVLSDEQKRKEYDAKLAQEKQSSEAKNNYYTNSNSNNTNANYNSYNYANNSSTNQKRYYQANQNVNNNANRVNPQSEQSAYNQDYSQIQKQYQEQLEREKQYREQLEKEKKFNQDYQNAINKAYHDAYIQDLKSRGYKIRYKKTKKDYLRSLIALLITIGIIVIIANLPFVQDYFKDLYNNNPAFKQIVDLFSSK